MKKTRKKAINKLMKESENKKVIKFPNSPKSKKILIKLLKQRIEELEKEMADTKKELAYLNNLLLKTSELKPDYC